MHPTNQPLEKRPAEDCRYPEIDSLRGLAAVTVLLFHYSGQFSADHGPYQHLARWVQLGQQTPLYVLYAGHEAVVLFFVLSGFVLALPSLRGKTTRYDVYALKRVFRIYVPYLFALAATLVLDAALYRGPIGDLSDEFNTFWATPMSLRNVAEHVTFLGSYPIHVFNIVIWSLVHELRISLLFPALVLLLARLSWQANIALALASSAVGAAISAVLLRQGVRVNYFLTAHYTAMFIAGYLLARHLGVIRAFYRARSPLQKLVIALFGFVLYTCPRSLCAFFPAPADHIIDLLVTLGAALLVITALSSRRASAFLRRAPVRFLGEISYSLYLYHFIVMLAFLHAFHGRLPVGVILALACATSIVVAYASHRWVELRAIRIGKSLSLRLEGKAGSRSVA